MEDQIVSMDYPMVLGDKLRVGFIRPFAPGRVDAPYILGETCVRRYCDGDTPVFCRNIREK